MSGDLIHLDTNILILAAAPQHPIRDNLRLWRGRGCRFAVSAMAWAEFRCGPITPALLNTWEQLLEDDIVDLDRAVAEQASVLFNLSGRRARSLPDCLIAATAIAHGANLATLNREDFEPLLAHGLSLM